MYYDILGSDNLSILLFISGTNMSYLFCPEASNAMLALINIDSLGIS